MPNTRVQGRGPGRGTEEDTTDPSTINVNPIRGPQGRVPGGPEPEIAARRKRVALEEAAFRKKGSQAQGNYTARQSGARALAIRHFEEAAKGAQAISAYRKRKATI